MRTQAQKLHLQISGGIGDVLAITPVLKALKQQDPMRQIVVFFISSDHRQLLQNNPYIDQYKLRGTFDNKFRRYQLVHRVVRLLASYIRRRRYGSIISLSVGNLGSYGVYRIKMAQILAQPFGLKLSDTQLEIYLSEAEEDYGKTTTAAYAQPVVINPIIRSRKHHTWPLSRWETLIKQHPDVQFLQLGLPDEPLLKGAIDCRRDHPNGLREMIAILKHVKAYVGMDTFWQHAAAAVNTPGVVLHGDGHPAVFGHELHVNLYKNLRCAPCLHNGLGNHSQSCPYDAECITSISVDEVSRALEQRLE